MRIIRDIGVRQASSTSKNPNTRGYMWAEFECPTCKKIIERMKHQGKSQKQCPSCFRISHAEKVTTHGERNTRLYRIWVNMRTRCNNPKDKKYYRYGGRGITIYKEWESYRLFALWARSNGYAEELTIDRTKVDGNYCPENCSFIPKGENAGKDKIVISLDLYKKILLLITAGAPIASAYTSFGVSRTAYYNAKKRYKDHI